jgi:hypothetical protein
MDRKAGVALAVYLILVASLVTPLYEPLGSGRDESWALLVLLASAHAALGAAISRTWVLALPVALAIAGFLAGGADGLAWLTLIIGAPALVAFTAAGWALGHVLKREDAVALGLFAVALLPAAWAVGETRRRGPHVPDSVQAQLPTKISLGNLCPDTDTPPAVERDVRRRAEALIRELRRRPDQLVTYTYYYSDDPQERRDITIRELAEEQLADIESGGPDCDPELERRIRAAM